MEVFIPWLHWLSKLDIFSCINNIWNFSLTIISCWFLKGVLRCWSLSQSFQLFWIFSAFEWKSWNSFRAGVYLCTGMCEYVLYKTFKAFANVWYFLIPKGNSFLYKRQRGSSSSLSGDGRLYLICMKRNLLLILLFFQMTSVTGFCSWYIAFSRYEKTDQNLDTYCYWNICYAV